MPNGYSNNGSPDNAVWKTKQDDFRGYTRAKLENIHEDVKEFKALAKKNEKDIHGIKLTAAIFGGAAGAVAGFLRGFIP